MREELVVPPDRRATDAAPSRPPPLPPSRDIARGAGSTAHAASVARRPADLRQRSLGDDGAAQEVDDLAGRRARAEDLGHARSP